MRGVDIQPDPIQRFAALYAEAKRRIPVDPNAMVLSTVGPGQRPSSRVVLLKDFDARGFVFFTNFESRKGGELQGQPFAALVFYWAPLERQVRVSGRVEQVSAVESDAYFRSRPFGHRLGALASPQSRVIPSRQVLEDRLAALLQEYEGRDVPRPGGPAAPGPCGSRSW